jgi:transcriptional regulator with XRE-family HTH domain
MPNDKVKWDKRSAFLTELVRLKRNQLGVTQKEFAELLGVNVNVIGGVEAYYRCYTERYLFTIANSLELDLERLYYLRALQLITGEVNSSILSDEQKTKLIDAAVEIAEGLL